MHNHMGKTAVHGRFAGTTVALIALFVLIVLVSTTAVQAKVSGMATTADDSELLAFEQAGIELIAGSGVVSEPKGATGSEIYLIRLSDPPVAAYRGGIDGFAPTNPSVRGQDQLNMDSTEVVAYSSYLQSKQVQLITRMEEALTRSVEVVYQYYAANNGIAAYMTPAEAQTVSRLPGVIFVQRNFERELHTDNGPTWIGAPAVWHSTKTVRNFHAELSGAYVVPPTTSTSTGTGEFTYDFTTNLFTWNISTSGLSAPITGADIRVAPEGEEGPVVISLQHNQNPIIGSETLTEEQEGWLVNGLLYVEFTAAPPFEDGEIRGQIVPSGSMGEGIIIGVIDTGINPSNPSFADIGGDSYDHTNPWGPGNYVGVCDPADPTYDSTFPCNDKLIGAWGYTSVNGGDPRDYDSHGSHTASTAGGNFVFDASVVGPTITLDRVISGVAPHANIVAYSACCTLAALSAAIDQVVIDGVDVVNYSIGSSSPSDVWNDFDTVGYLNAREAGIFVATSAGNEGPGAETVGSPADAPWLLSVGATTHDRKLVNSLVDMTGGSGSTTPPDDIFGKGFTSGYGSAEIVYAGDYPSAQTSTPELCGVGSIGDFTSPWPAGTFNGEIVICDRGTFGRVEKGANVLAAGAGGYILANDAASGDSLSGDAHDLPAVHISYDDGVILKDWVTTAGPAKMGRIAGLVVDEAPSNADIMAAFSSRGANRALPDIIVPSVAAPGVDILAAVGIGDPRPAEWGFMSGTSMASPHAAGAAALVMATNPGWSPAEVQSALMTTAWTDVLDNDEATPADPFDRGSGRIDLSAAANAGLLLNETAANYWAADPSTGGDPKTLNLASFGNAQCVESCSWTRTVESALDSAMMWTASVDSGFPVTVEPASFTLEAGATELITVTADVTGLPADEWVFAEVQLTPADAAVSTAHLPVGVRPTTGVLPELIDIQTRRDAGSQLAEDLTAIEITDLTVDAIGLAQAVMHEDELIQIADQGADFPQIFFDNLDRALVATTDVPADTFTLIYEVVDTASPDLDMLVGYDTNGNGVPELGEEVCQSAAGGPFEKCEIESPTTGPWWAIVINFQASAAPPDPVTLAAAVVPNTDNGNLWAEGAASVPTLEPFDIRVFWNIPGMMAGERWYGALSLGADPAHPGNIGTIRVDLERLEDDVTKTADVATASPGDTVNYTITVLPNSLTEDVTYWLTDTIPAGMTYVPGSATATEGTIDVTGDTLTWTGTLITPFGAYGNYDIATSITDPGCTMPLATDGAYVDLEQYGYPTSPAVSGDTKWYGLDFAGPAFEFFGSAQGEVINFTDDGFMFFDPSTPGSTPWTNQPIPTPGDPDNLMATFWRDLVFVYDQATNRGVTWANLTSGGVPSAALLEYDDVEDYPVGSGTTYDFELLVYYTAHPARYEVIMAYDNLSGDVTAGTIGLESADGSVGVQYAYNDIDVTNGMAICYDYVTPEFLPITITYAVTVDAGASGTLTNNAENTTSNPGSMLETSSVDVLVEGVAPEYGVLLSDDMADAALVGTTVSYSVMVTNTGNVEDTFDLSLSGNAWPTALSDSSVTLASGASTAVQVDVSVPADAADGEIDTTTVTATSQGDTGATDSVVLTTTAIVEAEIGYGVELSADMALSGHVGTEVVYDVTVTNTGDVEDTFDLALSGDSWATTVSDGSVTLASGASTTVQVTVAIPANAAEGAEDMVTVIGTSHADSSATDSTVLTTTAEWYTLYLPIIAKNN